MAARAQLIPSRVARGWAVLIVVLAGVGWSTPAGSQPPNPCDSTTVVPSGQDALRGDCYALWEFYQSLDDPGRLDDEGTSEGWLVRNLAPFPGSVGHGEEYVWRRWGPDTPLSEWFGVLVKNGRVFFLGLRGAGISGPISPALGRLTALRYLHTATPRHLPGAVYESSANAWTGTIPEELGDLEQLEELTLDGMNGPVPPELGGLANLQLLAVDNSTLAGPVPAELGNLSRLLWLSFHNEEKPDSGGLAGPIPAELGNLSKVRMLRFRNHSLSGPIPPELGKLANLGYMLDLSGNELSRPIPPGLGRIARATRLDWALDLSNNQLSGPIPPQLGQVPLRGDLNLSNNQLSGPIPAQLGQLTQMGTRRGHGAELNLANNGLSGPIPSEINKLTSLHALNLANNELSGPVPTLRGFDSLQHLYLHNNMLVGSVPQELGALPSLRTLNLGGNHFSSPPPGNLAEPRAGLEVNVVPRHTTRRLDSPCTFGIAAAGSRADCDALWEFYSTLEDRGILDDPANPGQWGPHTPLSEWYGVELGAYRWGTNYQIPARPVVGLDLHQAGISGPLSPALGDLQDLEYLRLSLNDLTGPIPAEISRAEWLRTMDLSFNQLTGLIPHEIGATPSLTSLDLRGNPFTQPVPTGLAAPRPDLWVGLPGRLHQLELSGPAYTAPGIPTTYTTRLPDGVDHSPPRPRISPKVEVSSNTPTGFSFTPPTGGTYQIALITEDRNNRGNWYVAKATLVVFADITAGATARPVAWLAQRGITHGCGNGRFCPNGSVTRGQMAAFFNRALKLPAADSDHFDDDTGSVFEDDINRLAQAGITQGCKAAQFCPTHSITRGQMAAFLTRALDLPPTTRDHYVDDDGTTHENSINRLTQAGIAQGCNPHRYCPNTVLTRQEMAGLLYRARTHLPAS